MIELKTQKYTHFFYDGKIYPVSNQKIEFRNGQPIFTYSLPDGTVIDQYCSGALFRFPEVGENVSCRSVVSINSQVKLFSTTVFFEEAWVHKYCLTPLTEKMRAFGNSKVEKVDKEKGLVWLEGQKNPYLAFWLESQNQPNYALEGEVWLDTNGSAWDILESETSCKHPKVQEKGEPYDPVLARNILTVSGSSYLSTNLVRQIPSLNDLPTFEVDEKVELVPFEELIEKGYLVEKKSKNFPGKCPYTGIHYSSEMVELSQSGELFDIWEVKENNIALSEEPWTWKPWWLKKVVVVEKPKGLLQVQIDWSF